MNRAAPVDSPWPLEDGERVLWEGAPDAAPTKDDRAPVRRGVAWAAIAAALFAALLVWRLGFGDEIVLHPADPSLGDVVFDAEPVDGALALFAVLVPLHLLLFFFPFFERRRLRNARFALTDRRLLRRFGAKPPNAIPLSDVAIAGRDAPDALGRVRLRVFRRSSPPARSSNPAGHHPWIGPFPPAVADAFDAALRSALGLPPTTDAPESKPGDHVFPSWMDERERKRIAASLAPGERLLWCGRPAGTVPALFWILWAGLLVFLLCGFTCLIRLEDVPSVVSRFLETERLLFVRIGGAGGWMAGIVFGLFVAVYPAAFAAGLFIIAEEPWRFRRGARCVRYLVSDRRTWHMLSSPSPDAGRTPTLPLLDGGGLPWKPVVRRAGSGRSDVLFRPFPGKTFDPERVSKRNATGFLDLPDADVPAALAALEELRNSAAP